MQCHISAVPRGEHEGAPCLDVSLSPADTPQGVLNAITRSRRAGFQAWHVTAAPWGAVNVDEILLALRSDPVTSQVPVIASIPLEGGEWANTEVFWQGDASTLLAHQIAVGDLVERVGGLPFHPRLSEVVVVNPHINNVHPALLDELYTRTDPDLGWVYAPADASENWMSKALHAISQCDTPWRIRREHERSDQAAAPQEKDSQEKSPQEEG